MNVNWAPLESADFGEARWQALQACACTPHARPHPAHACVRALHAARSGRPVCCRLR